MLQQIPPESKTFPSSGYNPKPVTAGLFQRKKKRAQKQYIRWLNRKHPEIVKEALQRADLTKSQVGLSGLGQENTTEDKAWYETLLDYVPQIASGYAAMKQQEELIELNRRRAEQGLPPLESAPTIKVEAGTETRASVRQGIREAAGQYIPWIAGGLGLWFLMQQNKPRRRR